MTTVTEEAAIETVPFEIVEAERQVRNKKLEFERRKQAAKVAKEEWVEAGDRLCQLIREFNEPNLFNQPAANGHGDAAANPEAWRGESIDVLDLGSSLTGKLNEASIYTIGDLQDYTDPAKHGGNPNRRITDIDGIGPAAAERIEEAMTRFWERWRAGDAVPSEDVEDPADEQQENRAVDGVIDAEFIVSVNGSETPQIEYKAEKKRKKRKK